MNASWHPEAEAELISAARWYSARVPGLGGDFLDAVDTAVRDILSDPTRFASLSDGIRLYLLSRFPYGIYFRAIGDTARILAVRHHRQHPDAWKGRR
jgi:plasmid stabilization system protein ParE